MAEPTALDGGFSVGTEDFSYIHTAEVKYNEKYLLDNTTNDQAVDNLPDTFAYYRARNFYSTDTDFEDCYEKFTFTLSDMSYRLLCIHLKFEVTEYTYYHNYEPDGPQYRETKRVGAVRIEYTRKDGSVQHINLESLVTGGSKVFDGWVNIQDEVSSIRVIGTSEQATYIRYTSPSKTTSCEEIINLKYYHCCPYFIKPSHLVTKSPKWGIVHLALISWGSISCSLANSVCPTNLMYYYNGLHLIHLFERVVFGQEFWLSKNYGCTGVGNGFNSSGTAIVYV